MSVPVRVRKGDDVNIPMLESFGRDNEITDWRDGVAGDFCALALLTLPCPLRYVLTYGWPDKLGADCLPGPLDAWMTEAVDCVEDAAAPRVWDERSRGTVGDVYDNLGIADVDLLEV